MTQRAVIGLDIGGTKCGVIRADEQGRISEVRQFPTGTCRETLERMFAEIAKLQPGKLPLFGVSCGDPQDAKRGIILGPPNLPGWDHVPIKAMLEERFGGEAHLMNDANAGALAEWRFGAGRGTRSMVFITCGTGFGAGMVLDGRLYEGASGAAGEIGHVRLEPDGPVGYGKAGSAEGFCSGAGSHNWRRPPREDILRRGEPSPSARTPLRKSRRATWGRRRSAATPSRARSWPNRAAAWAARWPF